jgi:hypothetical protein
MQVVNHETNATMDRVLDNVSKDGTINGSLYRSPVK